MKVNLQEPEKPWHQEEGRLTVHSIFKTVQGEGPSSGTPAIFVRLAGCNLQCPGCDTDYTSMRNTFTPKNLVQAVKIAKGTSKIPLMVITGGEPFRQNFAPFARLATYAGFRVEVETNGTLWFDGFFPSRFSVICSPKTPTINSELHRYIKALKYIVRAGEIDPVDGLPTSVLENGLRPARPWKGFQGEIFIQPMDETDEQDPATWSRTNNNVKAAVDICLNHGYRLSYQIHKDLGMP